MLFSLAVTGSAAPSLFAQNAPPLATLGPITNAPADVTPVPFGVTQAFQRRIGRILVRGNTVTKDRVVRQYLDLVPGEVVDTTKLRTSQQNLIETRLFAYDRANNILPMVEFAPTNDPLAEFQDIIVQIQETQTSSLMFGGALNSDAGLGASVVYHERNFDLFGFPWSAADLPVAFRGAGQEFRVEAVPGTQVQRYLVSFREPRLFGTPLSIFTRGRFLSRSYSPYDEERAGGLFRVGYDLSDRLSTFLQFRGENIEITDPSDATIPDLQEVLGSNALYGFKLGVVDDTRDSNFRPTQGHLAELAFEQVLGDFEYPIITATGQQYWTLTERPDQTGRHVLEAGIQLSYTGSQTPLYERFYAGGLKTIRGFQFRGISPLVNDVEVGGDFMLLANLEYQFPLTADDQWFGVLFVDSGTVEQDFEINDYRVALGAGLRVQTALTGPIPLALDVAFPVSKMEGDDRQIVSFFVGFIR